MTTRTDRFGAFAHELRALVRLAIPVVGVSLGMRLMSTVDIMMVGQVSDSAMASVSIGNAWVWMVSVFGVGLVTGTEPMFAQAFGARDEEAGARTLLRGLAWCLLLTIPIVVGISAVEVAMRWTGQPEAIVPAASSYARIVSVATFPMLAFALLRLALQARARVRVLLIAIVVSNVFNLVANYALVFGNFGFPAMGSDGSAWATAASRLVMCCAVVGFGWPVLGGEIRAFADREVRARALRVAGMSRIAAVGTPIGIQMGLEMGVFAATTLTIGSLGEVQVAGHQVALDLASLTFMVPLGLGGAAAVRVGHAVGRGDGYDGVRRASAAALGVSLVLGVLFAAVFALGPTWLAGLYTGEGRVVRLGASLLPIAGVFQVFDGLQAVAAGVLRGLGRTGLPMVINLVGFWLVGFPVGWWLTFEAGMGAAGMWWGFVVGLGSVAVGLLAVVAVRLRRVQERIGIDG